MSAQVDRLVAALEKRCARVVTRLAVALTAELQETTPVDTGWARALWIPAVGQPDTTPRPRPVGDGAAPAPAGAGLSALAGYSIGDGPVFVSNRAPYIRRLNDGHSKQAPRGFVQAAIARVTALVIK